VVVFDGVLTSDVTAPLEVFGAAARKAWLTEFEVTTVSADADVDIVTEEGLRMRADVVLSQAGDFDVLIVPSSYSMTPLVRNRALIEFVRRNAQNATWIVSNCSGARILAEAGLLDGRRATTWAGGEAAFQHDYPRVQVQRDQNYVIDGRFLTSNGGLVSYQGALALLSRIAGPEMAAEVASDLQAQRMTGTPLPVCADPVSDALIGVGGVLAGLLLGLLGGAYLRQKKAAERA